MLWYGRSLKVCSSSMLHKPFILRPPELGQQRCSADALVREREFSCEGLVNITDVSRIISLAFSSVSANSADEQDSVTRPSSEGLTVGIGETSGGVLRARAVFESPKLVENSSGVSGAWIRESRPAGFEHNGTS